MLDIKHILGTPVQGIDPVSAAADVAADNVADLQEHEGCAVLIAVGTFTNNTAANASWAYIIEESDDNVTYAAVVDADLDGTEPTIDATAEGDTAHLVHYRGTSRYVRCRLDGTNPTNSTLLTSVFLLPHHPRRKNAI